MQSQTGKWHVAQWGTWGWIETVLKLIALTAGIVAYANSLAAATLPGEIYPNLAAIILFALLTLGSVAQLGIRFRQREIISVIFAVINLLGHLGLLIDLPQNPSPHTLAIIFGVFYVLGQVVKLQFLRVSGYTEGGADTRGMLLVSGAMTAAYALFAVLLVV